MSSQYAKDQPAGFNNRVEKVAIVGVSISFSLIHDAAVLRLPLIRFSRKTNATTIQAGGTIGSYFTKHLVATGKHTITALARAGSKASLPEGVRRVEIDYTNEATLVEALQGQDALIITLGAFSGFDPLQPERKLIDAAAQAGVPYVMPNCYGPDPLNETLMRETGLGPFVSASKARIEELGVSKLLLLACGYWYEWSLVGDGAHRFGCSFEDRTMTFFDQGEEKITTTTWEQCGRALAALLSLKRLPEDANDDGKSALAYWAGKQAVYISSFRVSQKDMFESAKRATGTTDADWKIEYVGSRERWEQSQEAMKQGDRKAYARIMYTRVFFPTGEGDHTRLDWANKALGLPQEDLDEQTKEGLRLSKLGVLSYPASAHA